MIFFEEKCVVHNYFQHCTVRGINIEPYWLRIELVSGKLIEKHVLLGFPHEGAYICLKGKVPINWNEFAWEKLSALLP